jgi:hypothetical protein
VTASAPAYPVVLDFDPPAPQSRVTVFFRCFMPIPHIVVLYFLGIAQAVVAFLAWFAILFTGRYPAGMFGFSVGVLRWQTRVNAYTWLLTGRYPPFSMDDDGAYPVRVSVTVATEGRNRLTTFFRPLMVIPHFIVLIFVAIAAAVVLFISWFAALFTAQVPEGMHNFLGGVTRWSTRVSAYMMLLTDEYPPFSLS